MAKIQVAGELEVVTQEGKLVDALQVTDSSLDKTQQDINAEVQTALSNKADKESYVQLKITGTAIAHYSLATSVPTTTSGYYLADTNLSGSAHRVIVIVAGGAVVNELSPSNGDTYITTSDGHLWAATSNNTTAWTDCGQIKGDQGEPGVDGAQTVVQTTGTSTTSVMSQAAVTSKFDDIPNPMNSVEYEWSSADNNRNILAVQMPNVTIESVRVEATMALPALEGVTILLGAKGNGYTRSYPFIQCNGYLAWMKQGTYTAKTESNLNISDVECDGEYHDYVVEDTPTSYKMWVDGVLRIDGTYTTAQTLCQNTYMYWFWNSVQGSVAQQTWTGFKMKGFAKTYINGALSYLHIDSVQSGVHKLQRFTSTPSGVQTTTTIAPMYNGQLCVYNSNAYIGINGVWKKVTIS